MIGCYQSTSGGQKQRVAIARVMLKDPPICVLDEGMYFLVESVNSAVHFLTASIVKRALLHQYCLVIATSALDARSEYHINQALKTMTKGRTVISIAHRLSTIKEADRIAVLNDGRIVETGTFDQLIQSKGIFHKLVEQQLTN